MLVITRGVFAAADTQKKKHATDGCVEGQDRGSKVAWRTATFALW